MQQVKRAADDCSAAAMNFLDIRLRQYSVLRASMTQHIQASKTVLCN